MAFEIIFALGLCSLCTKIFHFSYIFRYRW